MHRLHLGLLAASALAGGAATAHAQPPARCPSTQSSTFTNNDPTTGRLTLDGSPSKCGGTKAFPGANEASTVRYQTFVYENRTRADACVNVSVTATSGEVEAAAYLGGFSATNLALDYLGDPGGSASALAGSTKATQAFSFNVPALQPFTVMVEETVHGAGASYSVSVTDCGQVVATRVRPAFGPAAGGQSVAIDGEGFLAGATATLGGAPLTSVAVANDVALTGVSPAHAAGAVDVVVTNVDGSASTLKGAYTYVARAPSSVALKASPAAAVAGQPVTLSAQVAGKNDPGTIDGTVTFLDGATVLGKATVGASGAASITAPLHAGSRALTARYDGGLYFDPSTSPSVTEAVAKASTATALAASSNPASPEADVVFTATVAPVAPGAGVPTGAVAFSDGDTALGSATLDAAGHATWTAKGLAVGSHPIVATYGGDGDFTGSKDGASETIDPGATNLSLTTPGTSLYGWPVRFTVTVGGGDPLHRPTGNVTLSIDGAAVVPLAIDATGTATYETSDLGAGDHAVTATYAGDAQNHAGSASMTQTVQKADPTVTITTSENPASMGDTFDVTVTVSALRGAPPTGSVTLLGIADSVPLVNGVATVQASTSSYAGYGPLLVAGVYSGDANYATAGTTFDETVTGYDAGTPPPYDAGAWTPPDYDAGIPDNPATWTSDQVEPPPSDACACSAVGGSSPRSIASLVFGVAAAAVMLRRRARRGHDRITGRT